MSDLKIPLELVSSIFNPAAYAEREKMEQMLKTIRHNYPLSKAEIPGYDPHWIVTKYKDVREITRQDNIFHSGDRSKTPVSQVAEKMMRDYTGGKPYIFRTLVHMDPPDHTAYRDVVKDLFLPQNVAKLETTIREMARRYVDRLAEAGPTCDFAHEVAMLYPLEVVCTLIGLPKQDHATMLRLTQWFLSYADPDMCRPGSKLTDPEQQIKTWQIVYDEFKDYYSKLIADRRANPREDLASVISNGTVNGQEMDERSLISYFVIASTAGHDTTAATTANSMWTLAKNPELFTQLKANRKLIPNFIEESIRWTSPAMCFIRSATEDYELSGRQIKKGDLLYISYLSANRDEEMFENPYEFRLDRTPNRQIGFGYGAHICVGQHLARMEMRILWEELIDRLESIEMAGEGKWQESEFVCGPKSVPIRFTMNK